MPPRRHSLRFCTMALWGPWGRALDGGNSSAVQDQLRSVQQVTAGGCAFAAILEDKSVIIWGTQSAGGDSSEVQDQLRNVCQILPNSGDRLRAFWWVYRCVFNMFQPYIYHVAWWSPFRTFILRVKQSPGPGLRTAVQEIWGTWRGAFKLHR